ncbi:hypothetical protein BJ742DRAFT_87087 [Cladochytrium replicatum]|nr:hypothetical protein BJ742DRAFT_87087 [Cladochytrium replicatum]
MTLLFNPPLNYRNTHSSYFCNPASIISSHKSSSLFSALLFTHIFFFNFLSLFHLLIGFFVSPNSHLFLFFAMSLFTLVSRKSNRFEQITKSPHNNHSPGCAEHNTPIVKLQTLENVAEKWGSVEMINNDRKKDEKGGEKDFVGEKHWIVRYFWDNQPSICT